jgi:hypothetical protein
MKLFRCSELRAKSASPDTGTVRKMFPIPHSEWDRKKIPRVVVWDVIVTDPKLMDVHSKPLAAKDYVTS